MNALTRIARVRARRTIHHLKNAWLRIRHREHKMVAKVAVVGHLSYYGLVFVESHGMYGKAALVCGVVLLVEVVLGGGHDQE